MACSYVFKYIIVGESGVGKSCLMFRFTEQGFLADNKPTVGVEFGVRTVEVNQERVKLQIWDTAGQERFRALAKSYYRGAAGVLLVYDIARRSTYNAIQKWLDDSIELTGPNTVKLLIGNKSDLDEQRDVTTEEAEQFAAANGLAFAETSAKTGERVDDAFVQTAKSIFMAVQDGHVELNAAATLKPDLSAKAAAPSGGCC
eukprot:m.115831 g.115831  ORF g.115831 m.115831 type:complete len:201 (-) comp13581_c0_seq1:178-780(-)